MISRRNRLFLLPCLLLLEAGLLGCQSANERHVRGMMWYRPEPKPGYDANTFSVGRYGRAATSDYYAEGTSTSGGGQETSSTTGSGGSGATYGVYGSTATVGDSMGNSAVGTRWSERSTTMGVYGGTSTSELGTEESTQVGTGW